MSYDTMNQIAVAGVDVGGPRKGFHAVLLENNEIRSRLATPDPAELAGWLKGQNPRAVAIDSPCRWANQGRSRPAERELGRFGVRCFYTPTLQAALAHQKHFYDWVFQGERLYQLLEPEFPLFEGVAADPDQKYCFETFPHAIVCALTGRRLLARNKKPDRLQLLAERNLNTNGLNGMDWIDATLCAISAQFVLANRFRSFGNAETGFILIPALNLHLN